MFDMLAMPWLPIAPADFRRQCGDFASAASAVGSRLVALANHQTDSAQARAFGKMLGRLQHEKVALDPLVPTNISVLGSGTLDIVLDALPIACARHSVAATIVTAESDQIVQTALDKNSPLFTSLPDVVFLQIDHRWLGISAFAPSMDEAVLTQMAMAQAALAIDGLRSAAPKAEIVVTNIAVPPGSLFGNIDGAVPGTIRRRINLFNTALSIFARASGVIVADVAALADQIGTTRWFDPVRWNHYKIPLAANCAPLFADMIARTVAAIRGKARKCLVLDCDNTLWGGVIGDDGINAIKIGNGDPESECFLAVQQLALDYKNRGIILAVCSKNDDNVAIQPFREHEGMLLREPDIAVFQANWSDKPSNLEAIAQTLNIGIDTLVFLDDNAAERAQVRRALPLVAVPELPNDPAYYPLYVASAGYFDAVTFLQEDVQRAASYQANARRAEVRSQARDLGSYLDALDMKISIRSFDDAGIARIAQLVNKSNQFNLTTRRYGETELRTFGSANDHVTMQVRLRDKFSDFGMIGVIIACKINDGRDLDIDSWLMSCRVLGRRVENGMLNELVNIALQGGCQTIISRYVPTSKNGMVSDFFEKLGFLLLDQSKEGIKHYSLDVATFIPSITPFSYN